MLCDDVMSQHSSIENGSFWLLHTLLTLMSLQSFSSNHEWKFKLTKPKDWKAAAAAAAAAMLYLSEPHLLMVHYFYLLYLNYHVCFSHVIKAIAWMYVWEGRECAVHNQRQNVYYDFWLDRQMLFAAHIFHFCHQIHLYSIHPWQPHIIAMIGVECRLCGYFFFFPRFIFYFSSYCRFFWWPFFH